MKYYRSYKLNFDNAFNHLTERQFDHDGFHPKPMPIFSLKGEKLSKVDWKELGRQRINEAIEVKAGSETCRIRELKTLRTIIPVSCGLILAQVFQDRIV